MKKTLFFITLVMFYYCSLIANTKNEYIKKRKFIDSLYVNDKCSNAIDCLDIWISNFDTINKPLFQLGYYISDRADCFLKIGEFKTSIEDYKRAYKVLKDYNDTTTITIINNIALLEYNFGNYPSALSGYNNSLALAKEKNINTMIPVIYNNIAMVYHRKGDYLISIENYIESYEAFEELKDSMSIPTILNNIGQIYLDIDNYDLAKFYTEKSLQICRQKELKDDILIAYNNLGSINFKSKNYTTAKEYLDSAYDIALQTNYNSLLPMILTNMGMLCLQNNELDSAFVLINQSIELNKKYDNTNPLVPDYINLGKYYLKKEDYFRAEQAFDTCINLGRKVGSTRDYYPAFLLISEALSKQNSNKQAYTYLKNYQMISDSLLRLDKQRQIEELEKKYNYEKQEKEIALGKIQIEKKQSIIRLIAISLLISIIAMIIILYLYVVKRKAYRSLAVKNVELSKKTRKEFECKSHEIKSKKHKTDTEIILDKFNDLIKKEIHLELGFNKEFACERIKTNRTYFDDMWKKHFKVKFNDHINDLRIEKAIEILIKSNKMRKRYDMQGIAEMVGYKSRTTFYEKFKNKMEMTPTQFINYYKEEGSDF